MTTKTEALKLALETYMAAFGQGLEANGIAYGQQQVDADKLAREALAQPEQEPTRPCRRCGGTGERHTGIDEAPTTICKPCDGTGQIAITAQPEQKPIEFVNGWDCEIQEADFEQDTITLKMLTSEYVIRAGKHWLSTTPPAAPRPWVGLTDDVILDVAQHHTESDGFWQGAIWVNDKLKELNHDNKN